MTTHTVPPANQCPFCVTVGTQRILCNRHTVALFAHEPPMRYRPTPRVY